MNNQVVKDNSVNTPSNGRKKKSRKAPTHPVTGDAQESSVGKRKVNQCRSPIFPASKQQKMFNEFDIVMQMESTEFSIEALDDIPIDQLFVTDQDLNLNDYLI